MKAQFQFNPAGPQIYLGKPGTLVAAPDDATGHFTFDGPDLATIAKANHIGVSAAEAARRRAVPLVVALWRLKAVLRLAGLEPQVDAAIAALPEPQKTVVTTAWQEGNEAHRNSVTIVALGTALGLDAARMDAIFTQAESIAV